MFFCGCDLGSATGKAVILNDEGIVSWAVVRSTVNPEKTAQLALGEALEKAGLLSLDDLHMIVGTGYGRQQVSFIRENLSEITCHACGAHWLNPSVRTVIDIGGQDCKVISVDDRGKVVEFAMNDKCAAGTGRFFEAMARAMDCSIDELANLALRSDSPAPITKQCSVFAESEVVTLINGGADPADIAAGIHDAIARRLHSMANKVRVEPEIVLSGGGARNEALARSFESRSGLRVARLPVNPQITGALGAALMARQKSAGRRDSE